MILKLMLLAMFIALIVLVWKFFAKKHNLSSKTSKIFFGLGAVTLIGGMALLYMNAKWNYDIQKLAASYKIGGYTSPKDINIIDSYEKDAKTIQILEINGAICEMPMIKVNGNWQALGISCKN